MTLHRYHKKKKRGKTSQAHAKMALAGRVKYGDAKLAASKRR